MIKKYVYSLRQYGVDDQISIVEIKSSIALEKISSLLFSSLF